MRSNLDYEEFYALIASVDILVPAFAQYGCELSVASLFVLCFHLRMTDYEDQASSTVALAAELKVSLKLSDVFHSCSLINRSLSLLPNECVKRTGTSTMIEQ